RVFVEAAIDFPEEEIDFLQDEELQHRINEFKTLLVETVKEATRGTLVNEGAKIAIVGRPNAGKSSLMNMLARRDIAIVTDIAGTTRDSIEQQIEINGIPVTLVDTAGLNDAPDQVEQIGIERSKAQAENADLLLVLIDSIEHPKFGIEVAVSQDRPTIYAANKIDISGRNPGVDQHNTDLVNLSANTGDGIDELLSLIQEKLELGSEEPAFSARTRHLISLKQASSQLSDAVKKFHTHMSGELFAEDLRTVQIALSDITGSLSADDLLGEIFSSFCIGK
ncbi:UNVERIFIED_CONTAM: hypothetical protein GTU68_066213, partial [Idotea baltica]|nr:hypothetical protein [Idotea baltica]